MRNGEMMENNYGSWESPITPLTIQKYQSSYDYLTSDQYSDANDNKVYWTETRPDESGRIVLISCELLDSKFENTLWTHSQFSVRSRVHEYGGAAFFVHKGIVYFTNDSDQKLYEQTSPTDKPKEISKYENCRYSNGFYSTILNSIFIVREDHRDKHSVQNSIVVIGSDHENVLIEGADFYASPRVNESGSAICWIEWEFPNMPWDNTRCCYANLKSLGRSLSRNSLVVVSSGTENNPISSTLPMWTIENHLLYIKDSSGYWNVWVRQDNHDINITPYNEDIGDPMWLMDYRKYNYCSSTGDVVITRKEGVIEFYNVKTMGIRKINVGHLLTYMNYPQPFGDGSVVVLGHSPHLLPTIYRIYSDGKYEILGKNGNLEEFDYTWISEPRHIEFPVSNNEIAHGYYYHPKNPKFVAPQGTLPPLLVIAHGGPTGSTFTPLNLSIQYWTSKGFAVLDVDYRGSTGYGKKYRHSLKGNWGVYDVDDCCKGAIYLVDEGLVDQNMLAIKGGSAGGYLALCCLTFREVFRAGSSLYGIGDLDILLKNTHKFESRYPELLIGKPEDNKQLYRERSPINFPEKIKCPIIFFQGEEDRVVPAEQAKMMHKVVKAAGVPCSLVLYPGEQHGFRRLENIVHQLETEFHFLTTIFGLKTGDSEEVNYVIDNWPIT